MVAAVVDNVVAVLLLFPLLAALVFGCGVAGLVLTILLTPALLLLELLPLPVLITAGIPKPLLLFKLALPELFVLEELTAPPE